MKLSVHSVQQLPWKTQRWSLRAAATLLLACLLACSRSSNQVGAAPCGSGPVDATAASSLRAVSQTMLGFAGVTQRIRTEGNDLNITLFNQWTTQDCGGGKNANINGFGNYITLTGSCNNVMVNGWGNTIHIQETASIEVMGDTNALIWERGRSVRTPAIQINGLYNSVSHLTPIKRVARRSMGLSLP